jgi:hypothetical protein
MAGLLAVAGLLFALRPCPGQQIYRNGFESNSVSWVKGNADTDFVEQAHLMTEQGRVASGPRAEYLRVQARQGSYIYYQLATPRAPVNEELVISLWVKANQPGVQLLARVVLPHERDPQSLEDRMTTLIRGDSYRLVGRWQQLQIGQAVKLCQQQQQMMQAQFKGQKVDFKDAYIDQLILNVYGGPGVNEVWVDDLEMGPVLEEPRPAAGGSGRQAPGALAGRPRPADQADAVGFNGAQLLVNGKRYFFLGIRHTTAPLEALRYAGFNTLWIDATAPAPMLYQATNLGFRLVPALPSVGDITHPVSTDGLMQEVTRFPEASHVLFWDLGDALKRNDIQALNQVARLVGSADPGRPLGVNAWEAVAPASRAVNLLGSHRWPLMTAVELPQYREWLNQRMLLALRGTAFFWTWIQTQAPDWYTTLVYERKGSDGFTEPVGPQPEQIRLLTYLALSAGCRGLAYWSDTFLDDAHQGRDRLLGVALLNQELSMLEPLLVTADGPPTWIATSIPEVKAAVFRTAKGVLVVPIWCGRGAQYVPGQASVNHLSITVPQVPQNMQAWEVTPADVRGLRSERVVGGTKITLLEFGLTSTVVFTADIALLKRFQDQVSDTRQVAAQWTYELALQELDKVMRIEQELEAGGHKLPDGPQLLKDAERRLRLAKEHWDRRLFAESYHEAQRALRPMRIVMRAQFDKATKELAAPVGSPYAVSFYTLAKHYRFMDEVRGAPAGTNLLPDGGFEAPPDQVQARWMLVQDSLDEVQAAALRVDHVLAPPPPTPVKPKVDPKTAKVLPLPEEKKRPATEPHEGKQCLMLQVKPRDPAVVPGALEATEVRIISPPVRLQPGSLVRVSGWIQIPAAITGSADGAMLYDSAGGEPLAVRLTEPTPWKEFVLYRRVPASGVVTVTLALTGLGTAYFDDIRVEPLGGTAGGQLTQARPR